MVGIAIVAVGGGGIRTMSQRWEAVAAKYDEEKPKIAAAARANPSPTDQARQYTGQARQSAGQGGQPTGQGGQPTGQGLQYTDQGLQYNESGSPSPSAITRPYTQPSDDGRY